MAPSSTTRFEGVALPWGGVSSGGTMSWADDREVERDQQGEGHCSRYDRQDQTGSDALPGLGPTEVGNEIFLCHAMQILHEEGNRAILPITLPGLEGLGTCWIQEGVPETNAKGLIHLCHPSKCAKGDSEAAVPQFVIGEGTVEQPIGHCYSGHDEG